MEYGKLFDKIIEEENIKTLKFKPHEEKYYNKEVLMLPINSDKTNMKSKNIDYVILAILTIYSYRNPKSNEKSRFIYKKNIIENKDEIEKLTGLKIDTILRKIEKISKSNYGLIKKGSTKAGIFYKINYATECLNKKDEIVHRKYVVIELDILETLLKGGSNTIKTYIYIKYMCNYDMENKFTKISASKIVDNIGLSVKSKRGHQVVYDIIKWLKKEGLINISKRTEKEYDSKRSMEVAKTFNYFRCVDYERWIKYHDNI